MYTYTHYQSYDTFHWTVLKGDYDLLIFLLRIYKFLLFGVLYL